MENNNPFLSESNAEYWGNEAKYVEIIARLENYENLSTIDRDFIANNYSVVGSSYGFLYYFFVRVDWNWAYFSDENEKLVTIYDIFYKGSKDKYEFQKAIIALKTIFLGELNFISVAINGTSLNDLKNNLKKMQNYGLSELLGSESINRISAIQNHTEFEQELLKIDFQKYEDGYIRYFYDSKTIFKKIFTDKMTVKKTEKNIKKIDLSEIKKLVVDSIISKGSKELGLSTETKAIQEFFELIINYLGINPYAISSNGSPHSLENPEDRNSKIMIFMKRAINALQFTKNFKQLVKSRNHNSLKIEGFELSENFVPHILFRHMPNFHIERTEMFKKNEDLGQLQRSLQPNDITAFIKYERTKFFKIFSKSPCYLFCNLPQEKKIREIIKRIFCDQVIYVVSQNGYFDADSNYSESTGKKLYSLLSKILQKQPSLDKKAVFLDNELYFVEIQNNNDKIGSVYSLSNKEQQKKDHFDSNGNLKYDNRIYLDEKKEKDKIIKEVDLIINFNEMPNEFKKRLYSKKTLKPYFS